MAIHRYDPPVKPTTEGNVMAKPYKCPSCTKSFDIPQQLGAHRRFEHPGTAGRAKTTTKTKATSNGNGNGHAVKTMLSTTSETGVVRRYLDWLESDAARPGRRFDPDVALARVDEINTELADDTTSTIRRLTLIQERRDLETLIGDGADGAADGVELEDEFVKVAAAYAQRKGISRAAFREFGVPASVLTAAGI